MSRIVKHDNTGILPLEPTSGSIAVGNYKYRYRDTIHCFSTPTSPLQHHLLHTLCAHKPKPQSSTSSHQTTNESRRTNPTVTRRSLGTSAACRTPPPAAAPCPRFPTTHPSRPPSHTAPSAAPVPSSTRTIPQQQRGVAPHRIR